MSVDYLNFSGSTGDKIVLYADDGEIATDANMVLTTNYSNTGNTYSWTFDTTGNLTIPGGGSINTIGNGTAGITANATSGNAYLGLDDNSSTTTVFGNVSVQIGTNVSTSWNFYASGATSNPVILYASLPAPTTPGLRAFISDSNLAPGGNFGAEISGGGGNYVPVFSDGANWCIG